MKKIEPPFIQADEKLTSSIKDFWNKNINAERIMGKEVTNSERGSDQYFKELAEQRYRSHKHLLPWIKSMQEGKSVLEIGSGIGLDSYEMVKHGLKLTAIDLTENAINTIRERFQREGLEGDFKVADACHLPFPDNSFDYVYSFGVLHHTADTDRSIIEVHRVLKEGGEARIMLYHRHSLNEWIHRLVRVPFEEKDALCPVVRRFSKEEVQKKFESFSSVEINVEYLYGEGYGPLFKLTPDSLYRFLSKHFGWHLMIKAVK